MKEETDPAQALYKKRVSRNEKDDNNAVLALILAFIGIAAVIPFLYFFLICTFVSFVFCLRILRDKTRSKSEHVLARVALIMNGTVLAVILSTWTIFLALFFS